MGADKKVTRERAVQIVDKAAQEASDVIAATQADPMKKPKQLKAAVKEEVAKLVESGDPGKVVQYIKGHKKEFISGVYMSWFMKEVRAQLEGGGSGAAAATKQEPAAAASGKQAAAASPKPAPAAASANAAAKAPAPKAAGDAEPASKKQKVSVEGARPGEADADADTGKSASSSAAATKAA